MGDGCQPNVGGHTLESEINLSAVGIFVFLAGLRWARQVRQTRAKPCHLSQTVVGHFVHVGYKQVQV